MNLSFLKRIPYQPDMKTNTGTPILPKEWVNSSKIKFGSSGRNSVTT